MRKFLPSLFAFALVCLCSTSALATANYVYHEQTSNFVANPDRDAPTQCSPNSAKGRYVSNIDRVGTSGDGFQIYAPESYTLRFKVEFQFFTNRLRVYYTTDGSNPAGGYGVPSGTTQVVAASYVNTYRDCGLSDQTVDIAEAVIPPQPAGTTVKYIIGAYFEDAGCPGGAGCGPEVFANSAGPGCTGCGFSCTTSACATQFTYNVVAAPAMPLIISEFRTFGPTGTCDEFVEIYNNSNSTVTVQAFDGSAGLALARSNGNVIFTIPNNTNIPPRGHFLAVNGGGGGCTGSFSGSGYPGGGATTNGDTTMNEDIPSNGGIALFNTSNQANFNMTNRLDAVGPATELALYRENTGYPPLTVLASSHSLYRDLRSGLPKDTNNNESDFIVVNTTAASLCTDTANFACQRLGAPGPENLASPIQRNAEIKASLIDTQCSGLRVNPTLPSACRFERNTTAGAGSSPTTFGTLSIRRRFTNTTGAPVTRLRFRIVDLTTLPEGQFGSASGFADLRAITSTNVMATCQDESGTPHLCTDNASPTTSIQGTTLETDTNGQPNGGGYNSTLSLPASLAPGASTNIQFLLGVEQNGRFRFFINVEALPAPPSAGGATDASGAATKARATGKARAAKGSN
ncbi:MAG TPA: lamin tail domain-containing protein [Pyrinomonadaceae bacterium]